MALLGDEPLDYRARLLLRDSLIALKGHWDAQSFNTWQRRLPNRFLLDEISRMPDDPTEIGFPSLNRRLMNTPDRQTIEQFLRELSLHVEHPTHLVIGGSIALLLAGFLSRHTDDINVVDEVPADIRVQHDLLQRLVERYGLQLTHFQSHYLNSGWEQRLQSAGVYGQIHIYIVDPYDIFFGKLFSHREKDRDDLRVLARRLDKPIIIRRLLDTADALRSDQRMTQAAADNWFILFGQPLPQ